MNGGGGDDRFAFHARAVAEELFGPPNKALSSADELRFGKHGSMSVDLKKGTFFDHEQKEGGGVLWAIGRETGRSGAGAVEWMREKGFDVQDDRPAPAPRQAARLDPAGNWLPPAVPDNGRLTATYDYRGADGALAYQVCRYDWPDPDSPKGHSKTFLQRVPDPAKRNGWTYSTKGMTWLPYRLPELIEDVAQGYTIFIAEGEKKVDLLRSIGVPATCNHGGAGKFPESLAEWFKGAKVVVLPDNDKAGLAHAALIARRLEGISASVSVLEIPGLPEKGGVDDWIPAGGTAERLYDLVEEMAKPAQAAPFTSRFAAVQWADLDAPGAQHQYLIKDVLVRGEMSMLLGESQSGKSFLAIDLAMAVARGEPWFGHRVLRGGVVYQAGESATGVRRKRLPAYRIGHDLRDPSIPFVLLQGPLDLYSSDDPTEAFIEECRHWNRQFGQRAPLELIVIDTFNRATPGANENDGRDMGMVLARGERIRRETGAHVMFVHHLNAGGSKARGHTSLFANVENVIAVSKLADAHDSANRQVRVWKVAKQKDGEDGKETRFVLKGVEIGRDEDGDPVFSCIVAAPQRGEGEQAPSEEGVSVAGQNATFLRAVYTAIKEKGTFAPAELALGMGALAVERADLATVVRAAFDADAPITDLADGESEEDARRRRDEALKKAIQRAREHLYTKGVIGTKNGWTWLTGKRVRGFEDPPGLSYGESERRQRRRRRPDTEAEAIPPPADDLPFSIPATHINDGDF